MKPKEKAAELIDKFMHIKPNKLSDYTHIYYPSAKQCALIAVDEIIKANPYEVTKFDIDSTIDYWQEVKQEIEKL